MEKYIYHYTIFGQIDSAYGADAYSAGEYSQTSQVTQTGQEGGANSGGASSLANTGFDIVLPVLLGATMIAGSVIALVRMHKRKKITS